MMKATETKYSTIIGPPRSGTTWLHKYLFSHTNIGVTYTKEINWFNIETGRSNPRQKPNMEKYYHEAMERAAHRGDGLRLWEIERHDRFHMKTDQDYRQFFAKRFAEDQAIVDVSPGYSNLTGAGFGRIKASYPDAKVIILLRNPADRLWSICAHKIKNSVSDKSIQQQFQDVLIGTDEAMQNIGELYQTVRSGFAEKQVYCLFTEDLFSPMQDQTLASLVAFMGGEIQVMESFEFSANRGSYAPMPQSLRKLAVTHYSTSFDWARTHMGRLPEAWQRDLEGVNW